MDLWSVLILYVVGLGLAVAECFMPGVVLGLIGAAALTTSVIFGFQHQWLIGVGQIVLAGGIVPVAFFFGMKHLSLETSLEGASATEGDLSFYLGREGQTQTELRPAGIVLIDGRKVDVVTSGEMVEKDRRVRVVKVEGNRIVVKVP